MKSNQLRLLATISISLAISLPAAFAQGSNDFFNSSPSAGTGGGSNIERPPGVQAAEQQALQAAHGEYTQDEKRMQKKFKANLRAAQDLVTKGEKMLKDAEKKNDAKMKKKGMILKEVGEKRVKELKESDPMADKI